MKIASYILAKYKDTHTASQQNGRKSNKFGAQFRYMYYYTHYIAVVMR